MANVPACSGSHGPTVPSGHWTRSSAFSADPSPRWIQPSWPPACPPPTVSSRATTRSPDPELDPGADRVAVRTGLAEPDRRPLAERRRRLGRAGADVAPELHVLAPLHLDEVEQAVEVEVHERRAAALREVDDPGVLGALDERAVGLPEQEVVGVLRRVLVHRLDVALGDVEVDERRRC